MEENNLSEVSNKQKVDLKPENMKPYHYWRDIQRKQLGASANLYMIFASAILGYVVNFLVTQCHIGCSEKILLSIAAILLLISLLFYGLFVFCRLYDFRKTARLYGMGKSEKVVGILTKRIGCYSWHLFYFQILWLSIGFVFALIGLSFYIY